MKYKLEVWSNGKIIDDSDPYIWSWDALEEAYLTYMDEHDGVVHIIPITEE